MVAGFQVSIDGRIWVSTEDLDEKQTRVTYQGLGIVAHHYGLCGAQEIGRPSSLRFIDLLLLELQYLVCRNDGTYSKKALAKWGGVAPAGYDDYPILSPDDLKRYLELRNDQDGDSSD